MASSDVWHYVCKQTRGVFIRNDNHQCQGLEACGASLSLLGRLVLSDLTGVGNPQLVNVRGCVRCTNAKLFELVQFLYIHNAGLPHL